MAQFLSKPFGMTPNGEKINEYIISNPGGLAVVRQKLVLHLRWPQQGYASCREARMR